MRRCYYCDEPFDDDVETCPLCEHPIVIDERLQTECETRRVSFDPGSDPEGPEILDIRCPYCTRDLLRDRYDVAPYCSYCGEISAEFAPITTTPSTAESTIAPPLDQRTEIQKEPEFVQPREFKHNSSPKLDPEQMEHRSGRWAAQQAGVILAISLIAILATGLLSGANLDFYWINSIIFATGAVLLGFTLYLSAILPRRAYFRYMKRLEREAQQSRDVDLETVVARRSVRFFRWGFIIGALPCASLSLFALFHGDLAASQMYALLALLYGVFLALALYSWTSIWDFFIDFVGAIYAMPPSNKPLPYQIDLDPTLYPTTEKSITAHQITADSPRAVAEPDIIDEN